MKTLNAIEVHNLSFSYTSAEKTLEGVSFDIPHGSICALVGPNGSGKTTLLKIMIGLLAPAGGNVLILGKPPKESRTLIGYVPQRFSFDKTFPITVFEILHMSHPGRSRTEIMEYLHRLNMDGRADIHLGTLSGGQLQRVLICRAMLSDPAVLFLDEPVSGVDVGGEQTFYELIAYLHREYNTTIVMVSHELDVVANFADLVLCVNKKLVCDGKPEHVFTAETLTELYGKEAAHYHHKE
ncbi:metal ABC transporter ATP-binding protein [Candidatus Uhrbacteria bacterium]|nr:metal ABC transporter ATP-binding protein [Candidatus Uhrbacteria bacterium]